MRGHRSLAHIHIPLVRVTLMAREHEALTARQHEALTAREHEALKARNMKP